ncbi:type II toxin-antitoxin system RelE/ParE family toxin [Allomuricauda sp. R78024]|uniref:type II toxin-antitoxin system RelE/ParE family toxin n=1 Tax=Allomuricauda sp. R78024 TaxID=3093867 RepID=UPI0037C8C0B2
MTYTYVLSEEAAADINEIFEFGEHKFGNTQAIKYLIGLEEHFDQLSDNPDIGRERGDIKKGLYSLPYISHIIFYRKLKGKLRIVRVLYGGRDLIRFLE